MLLASGHLLGLGNRAHPLLARQVRNGNRAPSAVWQSFLQAETAHWRIVGVARRIGENDDGRLQALRAVDRHDPHEVLARPGLSLELTLPRIEPPDESLQARRVRSGVGQRRVEQFVERIVGLAAKPRNQLAPSVPRADEQPVQQRLRRLEIGPRQERIEQLAQGEDFGLPRSAQMAPQAKLIRPIPVFQQLLLAPAHQGGDEQVREAQVVERLRGEPQRGHQVLHRERCAEPQSVDARHRHPGRVKPRHDQPGQFLALAHQDHEIPGLRAAAVLR